MTPTYYLHNGQLFEIDRMPPDKEDFFSFIDGKEVFDVIDYDSEFKDFRYYLSQCISHPHTFSGESRVVLPDQIEWRYEVWDGNFWKEVSSYEYSFAQVVNKRRVATPKITEGYIHSKDCTCALCLAKLEQAITGTPLNESYGYTSTSGISPEPYKPVDKCVTLGCQRPSLNDEYCEGPEDCMYKPLTAQPDKQGEGIVLKPTGRHFYAYCSNGAYLGILLKEVHGSFVFEQSPKAGYMDANVLLAVSKELDRLNNVRPSPSPQREDKDEMQTSQYLIGYDDGARDYKEVLEDHRRLVRELDVILNGEGAAKQASLCDIVAQLRKQPPAQSDQEAAEKWISDHGVKFMAIEQQRNAFLAGCTHVRAQHGESGLISIAIKELEIEKGIDKNNVNEWYNKGLEKAVLILKSIQKASPQQSQQPVDAVAFAEWIQDNKYEWRHDSTRHDYRKWRAAGNNHSIRTTAELLTLFSSQTKQP